MLWTGGLTLFGYSKTRFYRALENYDPSLIPKYDNLYGNVTPLAEHTAHVHDLVLKYFRKYDLTPYVPRSISFYAADLEINKKVAEEFYLKAREFQLSSSKSCREWAYRKAAWALDDLEESLESIHRKEGIDAMMKIKDIGKTLATQIEESLLIFLE